MAHRREKRKWGAAWATILTTLRWKGTTPILEDWTRMFRPNWSAIAEDGSLGKTDLRVLILCCTHTAGDNSVTLSQQEMAKRLKVGKSAISKAVQTLVRGDFLRQEGHLLHLNSRITAHQHAHVVARMRKAEEEATP